MALGDERLRTTDESGNRIFLHPAEVNGFFRIRRTLVQYFLIAFFLALPWIKINGVQLLLLDIKDRNFHILGFIFKAHDAPYIFLLLALGTLGLAFITSIFGRIWCGWGCPQTVFIDGIYRKIETLIQGNYIKRRNLQKQDWNLEKIGKMSLTWLSFFIVSTLIAHSFTAYFVGSNQLLQMMNEGVADHKGVFYFVVFMTILLLFDFGWFREQFCIIACPYGRIQSVLMDKKSISVLYDYQRGEPRKSLETPKDKWGDCVSCNRCVEVCPTGIDIRRGIQMECIGCTACIDACDEIMTKVKRPVGLIRYTSEHELETKKTSSWKQKILRPRVLVYFAVIVSVTLLLSILLHKKEVVHIAVLKAKEAPYSLIAEAGIDKVINHFKLHVHNQGFEAVKLEVVGVDGLDLILANREFQLAANSNQDIHLFVTFLPELSKQMKGSFVKTLKLSLTASDGSKKDIQKELSFVGPY
jgi:cytochrome c oxidase accessory protein FixG